VPSGYHQQWQRAMFWVRENTAENAVFAHWWDYGYWLQGIGERATVLDGGNAVGYWNHLMGRHGLTSPSSEETLTFFYTHNVSHFLIDWTDIGKYSAFSSIGSNEEYDRASWIPSFNKDSSRTQERKNSEVYFYSGGTPLDGDIVYEANGTRVFLPSGKAALGGILIEIDSSGEVVSQPRGIFVYQNQPYEIPLRYVYKDGLIDFGSGIEAGAFVYPAVVNSNNAQGIDFEGSILYLSPRTVNSQLARLYLYGEEDENFKLAHSEDEAVVSQLKSQGYNLESGFINFGGFRGPIKIWSVTYPEDIQMNEEYLQRDFPDQRIAQGR
jgi:hypothetical protein